MKPDGITIKDIYEEIYKIASKTWEEEDIVDKESMSEMIFHTTSL